MKLLATKEILPPYMLMSHIRSFEDMSKYLLFPFMQLCIPPDIGPPEREESSGEGSGSQ
jgi:hypothetical protein